MSKRLRLQIPPLLNYVSLKQFIVIRKCTYSTIGQFSETLFAKQFGVLSFVLANVQFYFSEPSRTESSTGQI